MLSLVQLVHEEVKTVQMQLIAHSQDEPIRLAEEIAALMNRAFPEGDPHGHRRHHEAVIMKAEARAEFWKKLVFEISKYGLLGFIGWAAISLWKAVLVGPVK